MKPRWLFAPLLAASVCATAHDFWIEPAAFQAGTGQNVAVSLCEGDAFRAEPLPRDAERIARFAARGPAGEAPIIGRDGRSLAGVTRFTSPGVYVLGYESEPAAKEIPAFQFEPYLAEKGLDRIRELRRQRGATQRAAREAYSRHAKAVVRVGDTSDFAHSRPMGLRLELVPESRVDEAAGGERSFRLLFDGQPLSGALVTATVRQAPDSPLHARTDADGRVRYTLDRPGEWLLIVVHMIEAPPGGSVQWESFWGSLTFELNEVPSATYAKRLDAPCAS